jgi:cyclase
MHKITKNVYVETGFRGCNVSFVVTKEGVVMIDTPVVPSEAVKWRDQIAKYGPIRYVINNEPHIDHVAGNCFFGGTLIAHEGARKVIKQISMKMLKDMLKRIAPESLPLPEEYTIRVPDITLSQYLTIYLGEHTFELMHLPGHTPYQLAVFVPQERVVFTSDNVVNGQPPFLHQAVPYDWLESLKQIEKLDVDVIVPGHGAICDRSYIPRISAAIQTWVDIISESINEGMTLEETQNSLHLQDYFPNLPTDDWMKQQYPIMIAHLYNLLKKR